MGSDYSRSSSTKDALQISTVAIRRLHKLALFVRLFFRETSGLKRQ
jgi:hypothetical protein